MPGATRLPDECAALPAAKTIAERETKAVSKSEAWPSKSTAALRAYVDPWEMEPVKKG